MSRDDLIQVQGVVTSVTGGGNFKVRCDTGHEVLARLSGRMKRMRIRVIEGDSVTVGLSPYDLDRGLITHRGR